MNGVQRIAATVLLILAVACAANADPIAVYSVRLSGVGGAGSYDHFEPFVSDVPLEAGSFGPEAQSYTLARASEEGLGAFASASAYSPSGSASAEASAQAQEWAWFVIEPDKTETVGSVATQLIMNLHGGFSTNRTFGGSHGSGSGIVAYGIEIEFINVGEFRGGNSITCFATYLVQDDCFAGPGYGLTASFSNPTNGTLTTDIIDVPLLTPFQVRVELNTYARAFAQGDLAISMTSDFGQTLTYNPDGPVFLLPPGYTVNSLDGSVVNNRWVGGATTTPVPEPASVLLLALGFLGTAARKHRRHPPN